ncbi:sugar phosphate isomerase/epimerase family protein [Streptomyces sp. NPDC058576]|uniref:sugar phosphate isomerase/epimerase family protein n=1 Tax=Streptomyces sp. NPDC058576 TaxID=3346547 RepID=UPI003663975B
MAHDDRRPAPDPVGTPGSGPHRIPYSGPDLRPGLCSVTLRAHPVRQVLVFAASAGLAAVEWGADVHVPPGDTAHAKEVAFLTADAGLAVASYGTYVRLGEPGQGEAAVLAAASALGAPRIRVWAGALGSARAGRDYRAAVAAAGRRLAARAADAGVIVGLEFHGGTLTDTPESAYALLSDIGRDDVGTYWQPPQGEPDEIALAGLDRVAAHVVGVHAFSWWPTDERRPLADRRPLWDAVAARLRQRGLPTDVLLEFVAGDDAAQLRADAATLRAVLGPRGAERGMPTA